MKPAFPSKTRNPFLRLQPSLAAVAIAVLGWTTQSQGAEVTYSSYTATDASDTSWVIPSGFTSVAAINYGGDATGFGGVTWQDGTYGGGGEWPTGNTALGGGLQSNYTIPGVMWGNNAPAFYVGGPDLLHQGSYVNPGVGTSEIYIGGLTVGTHYAIQFVVADNRTDPDIVGRTLTLSPVAGVTGSLAPTQFAYGDSRFLVVTADFVADNGTIKVTPTIANSLSEARGGLINGIHILQVSVDGSWTSTAGGNWTTPSNWQSNVVADGPDSTATFSAGTGSESITVTLDSNRTIGNLAFSNANYTLTGDNTLTLNASVTPAINVGTGLSSTIGSKLAGTHGVAKTGEGLLVLTGTNTYAGGTTVNAGTLSIQGNYYTMPSDGSVTINGGVLEVVQTLNGTPYDYNWYWGVDSTEIKTGGKLTINSHSHIHNLTLSGGELASNGVDPYYGYGGWVLDDSTTVNGGVTSIISAQQVSANNGGFVVEAGSTLNVTGTISAGNITKSGAGTMTLSGANTYTGATTINEGTLVLQDTYASPAFTIASGAVLELNVASGLRDYYASATFSGAGTLRKTGGGGAVWGSSAATIALGAGSQIDVQGGRLTFGSYANDSMSGSLADLNVAAAATFESAACDAYVNALTGAGTVILAYTNSYPRTMTLGVNDGGGTFSGTITDGTFGGNGNLIKNGSGTQTLSGINTYTGNTTVNSGSLVLADDSQLKFVVTDAPAANIVTGTGTATFNGDFTIDTAGVSGTTGHIWLLVDLANLDPATSFTSTFSVIGFTDPEDDGIWTMTDSKGDWSFDESTGELTLDVGNDYDSWKTANGVTGGENDDDDNDGLSNHEEYAFGLDPTGGSSVNPITVQLDKTTGKFTYTRRDTSLTGLTYTIWYSTNLATWAEDTGATEGTPVLSGEVETVEVTLTPALLTNPKLFIQVRAN